MLGITQDLRVHVMEDAAHAGMSGFNKDQMYADAIPVNITDAVIVRNGTEQGNSTVDLVMRDKDGKLVVTMITGNLLKGITNLLV